MATITGLTAERMLEIEAASVVDGDVVGNDLILARQDGSIINAGNVRGPAGPTGPIGSAFEVMSAQPVFDIGVISQLRAGRQLTPADFTNMGLNVPVALWNLSNANDSSGNARHLTIKGGVPFGTGINGLASTSAVFAGSTAQALYRADTGGADPLRIRTGSIGMWFRTSKKGVSYDVFGKYGGTSAISSFLFETHSSGAMTVFVVDGVTQTSGLTSTVIDDDRWHFILITNDGQRTKIYVDGTFENQMNTLYFNPSASAPLNIGGRQADAGNPTVAPATCRVDEAFILSDVLTDDQVRNLYCASLPHSLGSVPKHVFLSVRRKRRGAAPATTDFPAQPVRLYNFVGGVLTDQGSNNVPLTAPVGLLGLGGGPDGLTGGAYLFGGAHQGLAASDAGLPSGLSPRSYGAWVKVGSSIAVQGLISWGAGSSSASGVWLGLATASFRNLYSQSVASGLDITGPDIVDANWHHVAVVEEDTAADGNKRKMYVDGRLVGVSTTLASITLGGANRFRIGANADGTSPFTGQMSRTFVYAGALTGEQIRALYNLGAQVLAPSQKDASDHVEAMESARLLASFNSLEAIDQLDVAVMA